LLFLSCDNEIDINANWKETIIVYGLLDPLDSIQYIKVEKAFLDEVSSALVVAKISDSLYLDSAVVTLYQTDDRSNPIILSRTYDVPKDSGIFANDKNPLWFTKSPILADKEYEIEVLNPKTGKRVWARTNIISPALITAPVKNTNSNFSIFPEYLTVDFVPKTNSYAYDLKMEFVYDEFKKSDTMAKITKSVTWNMLTNYKVSPGVVAISKIPKLAFLQFLSGTISADTSLLRRLKYVSFTFYGANQTLADYISVNQPSIGIVQKTAEFTNINGGYGIFASRCVQAIRGVKMDPGSINIIRNHAETQKLNFIH
jgi:hypothetical protein